MNTEQLSIMKICKKYIKGTVEKAVVKDITILLCNLTAAVEKAGSFHTRKIYLNTRILKHLYDKKPAEEFDFVTRNIYTIVKYPDHIYKNRDSKRGELCFVKDIGGIKYLCSIETSEDLDASNTKMNYVVTVFRLRKENYINNYQLLWSWKGDDPSS